MGEGCGGRGEGKGEEAEGEVKWVGRMTREGVKMVEVE